jgi:hypothetical protein
MWRLKPQLTVTNAHDHFPQEERSQVLKACIEITTNYPPSRIIREVLLNQSDECLANMKRKQACRKLISRACNGKTCFG